MNRRNFMKLTGTCTGGLLLLPDFLYSFAMQQNVAAGEQSIVFVQLNGGNDGLNTFIPYQDELYYQYRPAIAISKDEVIGATAGMAFHPALKGLAEIQQKGDLTVIQNVGYPEPNRSHFRSQEIWQTGSASNEYLSDGWIGRYLDMHYHEHFPTASVNLDRVENLALKGQNSNTITLSDPKNLVVPKASHNEMRLSDNPQLDFVRKVANSVSEGSELIVTALKKSSDEATYPATSLGKNMSWIAKLIKGGLNSKVYYTSLNGFDTHTNQKGQHEGKLKETGDAVLAFYNDMKNAGKLQEVTIVIFSEFGRRAHDNGRGTDHGTAAPMFVIGGKNKGKIIGKNPDLVNLENGDLVYETDFRAVYAALLKNKFGFNPTQIGINNNALEGLF